jgi:hypothetical protein
MRLKFSKLYNFKSHEKPNTKLGKTAIAIELHHQSVHWREEKKWKEEWRENSDNVVRIRVKGKQLYILKKGICHPHNLNVKIKQWKNLYEQIWYLYWRAISNICQQALTEKYNVQF